MEHEVLEIKIIEIEGANFGLRKMASGNFHEHYEKYPYEGVGSHGDIVSANLIYKALYNNITWAPIPEAFVATSDRRIKAVYIDARN